MRRFVQFEALRMRLYYIYVKDTYEKSAKYVACSGGCAVGSYG